MKQPIHGKVIDGRLIVKDADNDVRIYRRHYIVMRKIAKSEQLRPYKGFRYDDRWLYEVYKKLDEKPVARILKGSSFAFFKETDKARRKRADKFREQLADTQPLWKRSWMTFVLEALDKTGWGESYFYKYLLYWDPEAEHWVCVEDDKKNGPVDRFTLQDHEIASLMER